MKSRPAALAVALGLCLLAPVPVASQPVAVRAVSVAVGAVGFAHTGNSAAGRHYEYEGPVLAVVYQQPSLIASAALGTGSPTLLDLAISGWLGLRALEVQKRGLKVPVILTIGHRRAYTSSKAWWDATRFGVGVGVQWAPPQTDLTVRANPTLSVVTSTLATGYGFAPGAEADAALVLAQVRPGMYLELGYNFRFQVWNINPPRDVTSELSRSLDYECVMHVARLGLRF